MPLPAVPVTYLILAVVSVGVGLFTLFATRRNQHQYSYDGGSRYRDYGDVAPLPSPNYSGRPRRSLRKRTSQQLSIEQSNSPSNVEAPTVSHQISTSQQQLSIEQSNSPSNIEEPTGLESAQPADERRSSTSSSESFELIPENRFEKCTICCEVLSDDILCTTTKCNHSFHSLCIVEWLRTEKVCPNCRGPLKLK